jgi:hypothetical protein
MTRKIGALVLAALLSASSAMAAVSVSGTYTGTINGTPLAATSLGTLDTTGTGSSDITSTFSAVPTGWTPLALGRSHHTYLCHCGSGKLLSASNLWDLSHGNYTVTRVVSWPTIPGSSVSSTATMTYAAGHLSYSVNMTGTYTGPTDIDSVLAYHVGWTGMDNGTNDVYEVGYATLHRPGGATLPVSIVSTYHGLSTRLPFVQSGSITASVETWTGSTLHLTWTGIQQPGNNVPAMSPWGILALTLVLAAFGSVMLMRKRQASALA